MLKSLELRWFFSLRVYYLYLYIIGLQIFYQARKNLKRNRIDYCLTTQSIDVGVKFSRQQLQVKIRKYNIDFTLNNNNIQGSLEYWIRYHWDYLPKQENTKTDKLYGRVSSIK
jgi:hypothetical protein